MSKETFWQELEKDSVYTMLDAERILERVEHHGGTIVWPSEPKEPPPPAVCTCPEWMTDEIDEDFGKAGPHHVPSCLFSTTF